MTFFTAKSKSAYFGLALAALLCIHSAEAVANTVFNCQAALSALGASGGTVNIPANSTCILTSPLIINTSNVTIQGSGATSVIQLASSSAEILVGSASMSPIQNVNINSLIIQSQSGQPSVQATHVSSGLVINGVTFEGGTYQILLRDVQNFTLQNTYHMGSPTANPIFVINSANGTINSSTVVGYQALASNLGGGAINVLSSQNIHVINPTISNIDSTLMINHVGISGVEFSGCNDCSISGGTISGLQNGDGVVVEVSSGVTINGTTSINNATSGPAEPWGGTGDGFDIYEASNVQISNCNASGNGTAPLNLHHGFEIYTSQNVIVSNCNASNSGSNGVIVYGSPGTVLNNVISSNNGAGGLYSISANGAGVIQSDGKTFISPLSAGESNFGQTWSAGTPITIGGQSFKIGSVLNNGKLVLEAPVPSGLIGVSSPWSVQSSIQIFGGQFNNNNTANDKTFPDGITLSSNAYAWLIGVTADDNKGSGLTLAGGPAWGYSNTFAGNSVQDVNDPNHLNTFEPYKVLGFDPQYYLANNPDVAAEYGATNYAGAFQQWLSVGLPVQGRRGSLEFDPKEYLAMYPDLLAAFGPTGYGAAYNHWLNQGMPLEGRQGSIEISPIYYLKRYPDISAAYGTQSYIAAVNHAQSTGLLGEGRQGSPAFDVSYYLSSYPDLSAAFGSTGYGAAIHHWIIQGLPVEGRQGSAEFSVSQYMQAYPSVMSVYGPSDFLGALENWISYGSAHGMN